MIDPRHPKPLREYFEARLVALLERHTVVHADDLGYGARKGANDLFRSAGMLPAGKAAGAWTSGPGTIDWLIAQKLSAEVV